MELSTEPTKYEILSTWWAVWLDDDCSSPATPYCRISAYDAVIAHVNAIEDDTAGDLGIPEGQCEPIILVLSGEEYLGVVGDGSPENINWKEVKAGKRYKAWGEYVACYYAEEIK